MIRKNFKDEKQFTDKMHEYAVKCIYPELGYVINTSDTEELSELKDMKNGVDYIVNDSKGKTIYIQERFRRYSENSFTLRYKRENSRDEVELFSEFFKIKQATRKMVQLQMEVKQTQEQLLLSQFQPHQQNQLIILLIIVTLPYQLFMQEY